MKVSQGTTRDLTGLDWIDLRSSYSYILTYDGESEMKAGTCVHLLDWLIAVQCNGRLTQWVQRQHAGTQEPIWLSSDMEFTAHGEATPNRVMTSHSCFSSGIGPFSIFYSPISRRTRIKNILSPLIMLSLHLSWLQTWSTDRRVKNPTYSSILHGDFSKMK